MDKKFRVVLKSLRDSSSPVLVVAGELPTQREADRISANFRRAKWDERRPGVHTIDHLAVCAESEPIDRGKIAPSPEQIIERVFRAVYPNGHIRVTFEESETWVVTVGVIKWEFQISSDDDCFDFTNGRGERIVFPFPTDWEF